MQIQGREFFAGSNSCYGFWSYFDSIANGNKMQRLLLKGGSGFGKSTMMKTLGAAFEQEGMAVEWFRCPSDPDSMDAIAVVQAGFCMMDATAPHALMPTETEDEIINLWEYWEPSRHKATEENHQAGSRENGEFEKWNFQRLYTWQQQEAAWKKAWAKHEATSHMVTSLKEQLAFVEQELFAGLSQAKPEKNSLRHFYAAAFTPQGVVHLSRQIFDGSWQWILLQGQMMPLLEQALQGLSQECQRRGIPAEVYHSPADPKKIDMLALPQKKLVVARLSSPGICYENEIPVQQVRFSVMLGKDAEQFPELSCVKTLEESQMTAFLQRRSLHHQMEEACCREAVDYVAIQRLTEQIRQRFSQQ